MGTAPDYLDPNLSYTSQAWEMQWPIYTGMLTYAHANGTAGAKIIPGLATALPTISDGGKTYTMTMRKGLVFSNGKPVKASDFAYTVERVIKLPWGGSGQFYARRSSARTRTRRARRRRSPGSPPTTRPGRSRSI